jgi:hypothetical protein
VWADVVEEFEGDAPAPDVVEPADSYVELTFADDAAWTRRLRRAADAGDASEGGLAAALELVQGAEGVSVIEATLESAGALFVAAEDDTQATEAWDDDD